MGLKSTLAATVLLAMSTAASFAGTAVFDSERNALVMDGPTDRVLRFQTLTKLKQHKDQIEYIVMSGPGGRMDEMVIIMRAIRDSGLPVIIPEKKMCASACALAAISSDTVIVDGALMFHMGYVGGYPLNATLHDILSLGQRMTSDLSVDMAAIGFKAHFLDQLIRWTGPDKWLVVTKGRQLDDCRMTGDGLEEYYERCYVKAPRMSSSEVAYLISSMEDSGSEDLHPTAR